VLASASPFLSSFLSDYALLGARTTDPAGRAIADGAPPSGSRDRSADRSAPAKKTAKKRNPIAQPVATSKPRRKRNRP
jgi:hypothetical protein